MVIQMGFEFEFQDGMQLEPKERKRVVMAGRVVKEKGGWPAEWYP